MTEIERLTKIAQKACDETFEKQTEINQLRAEIEKLRHDWAVACKDLGEARADNERLTEAHERIVEWSRAYPLAIFPKPDLQRAHKLLQAGGISLDAVSADAMRHVIEQVAKISSAALEPPVKTVRSSADG